MKVMFVDDEPMILNGLKRALFNSGWTIFLAQSGQQALEKLKKTSVDFVISDMQMPGMNGAELLEQVTKLYPETVRIVLSGQADKEMAARASFVAHQWFSKPCNPGTIRQEIERIYAIRQQFPATHIQRDVGQIKTLPSPPSMFLRIKKLFSEHADMERIAAVIGEDPALSAKVIQLSNSSFFMQKSAVTRVEEAIIRLGVEVVSCVVAIAEIYSNTINIEGLSIEEEQQHGMRTALVAASMVDAQYKEMTMLAGLFHDVGKYILYSLAPDAIETYISQRVKGEDNTQLEQTLFGVDHAQLAGYLLHLWNFPYAVIESILLHHQPDKLTDHQFGSAAATHIACLLLNKKLPNDNIISHFKLDDKIPAWKQEAEKLSQC